MDLDLLCRRRINTPTAPELGLFLDESIFSSYNSRWGEERGEPISLDGFKEQVADFKVRRVKGREANMAVFLSVLVVPCIWLHCQYSLLCGSRIDAPPYLWMYALGTLRSSSERGLIRHTALRNAMSTAGQTSLPSDCCQGCRGGDHCWLPALAKRQELRLLNLGGPATARCWQEPAAKGNREEPRRCSPCRVSGVPTACCPLFKLHAMLDRRTWGIRLTQ